MFLPIKFLLNTFEVTPATGFVQFDTTDILDSATTQVVETGYDYDVDRYSWDY